MNCLRHLIGRVGIPFLCNMKQNVSWHFWTRYVCYFQKFINFEKTSLYKSGIFLWERNCFQSNANFKREKNMSKFAKDELKKCTFLDVESYSQKLSYFNHLPKINPLLANFCQKAAFCCREKKNYFFFQSQNYLKWPKGLSLKHRNFSFLSYG